MILGIGFFLTLPLIVFFTTPEEKQHLTQGTTTMRIIEHHVGLLDVTPEERDEFKKLLEVTAEIDAGNSERDAWVTHVKEAIVPFGKSNHEAEAISQLVWNYAKRHEIDPNLILALITIESRFDPFAISSVGAQGLMQVMPFWKKEIGNPDDNLFDVATNIRYGCAILKHYIQRYRTQKRALAAYNGSLGKDKYPNKVFSQLSRFQ